MYWFLISRSMSVVAVALGFSLLAVDVPRAFAQEQDRDQDRSRAGRVDDATAGANVRISQLTGMTIRNMDGDNVGTVNDFVIEAQAGKIRYAAVSYGGFVGLGNKLFAVPWEAFAFLPAKEGDHYLLVLNVSEEKMKSAPGFDQNNWPNFADREFTGKLDAHYEIERREGEQRGVDGQRREGEQRREGLRRGAGQRQQERDRSQLGSVDQATGSTNVRASQLTSMTIGNLQDENVGTVNDIVIEAQAGKVRYVAVSYGGFLGLGDKLFAVPWQAFECRHNPEEQDYRLILKVSEEKMKNAPGFDQNQWPDFADPDFAAKLDTHYGIERQRTER